MTVTDPNKTIPPSADLDGMSKQELLDHVAANHPDLEVGPNNTKAEIVQAIQDKQNPAA